MPGLPGTPPGGNPPPAGAGGNFVEDLRARLGNLGNLFGNPANQPPAPTQPAPMPNPTNQLQQLAEIARLQNDEIMRLRGQLNQALAQANPAELERLRSELNRAELALAQLEQRLGKPPLSFGVVLRVTLPPQTDEPTPETAAQPTPDDLIVPGTRVRLLASHRLFGQVNPAGTIIGLDTTVPGTVKVQMDPTLTQGVQIINCRFGLPEFENGACDIAKIDDATEQRLTDPTRFVLNAEVQLRTNPNRRGRVMQPANDLEHPGMVLVEWYDDHQLSPHRIGPTGDIELTEQPVIAEQVFGTAAIAVNNNIVQVAVPPEMDLRVGMTVTVNAAAMQIVAIAEPIGIGPVAIVNRVLTDQSVEVTFQQGKLVVTVGDLAAAIDPATPEEDRAELLRLRPGDTVVLHSSLTTVIKKVVKDDDSFRYAGNTGVSWTDVAGLEEGKTELREAVETPRTHPKLYEFYHKKPPKGVLFYGPPGCGKTMLAKALATALRGIYGGDGPLPMLSVRGPELLDKWVGATEAAIRGLFAQADRWYEKHGSPLIIFIDEADAILRVRGSGVSSDMMDTIVPMFLSLMDGLDESHAIVVLATNRPDTLDPGVTREGRIDRKVYIPRPTRDVAKIIFEMAFGKTAIFNGSTSDQLAELGVATLWSCGLFKIAKKSGGEVIMTLGDMVSGAMIVNIVDQATSLAMRRDIAAGSQTGITQGDVVEAVNRMLVQIRDLDHTPELEEFTKSFRTDVGTVVKLKQRSNG